MTKINSATPDQWARIADIRREWIDCQTEQYDDETIRAACRAAYARMGRTDMPILVADSPASACLMLPQLRDQLRAQLKAQLGDQQYFCQWLAAWAGWMDGGLAVGAHLDREKYRVFRAVARHCHMILAFGAPVVSRNPVSIHWQDGRLHNESGPSVRYRDGWSLWSIGGVRVDEQIVMRPESQSIERIRGEKNEEVKRIRIERFGWTRYLSETGSERIDARRNDIEGTRESLYETPDGLKTLVCACPSTAKVFALEVDPSVESCEAAQRFLSSGLSGRIISAS